MLICLFDCLSTTESIDLCSDLRAAAAAAAAGFKVCEGVSTVFSMSQQGILAGGQSKYGYRLHS